MVFVLWAGSLWSLALWVAPVLFRAQSDRHVAGVLAAALFSAETYVSLATVAFAALLGQRARFWPATAAAALLAVNEWALKPVMTAARAAGPVAGLSFGAWHGVSALLYGLACVLAAVAVWRQELP